MPTSFLYVSLVIYLVFFFQNSRNHRILHILDYRVYLVITSSHLSVVACTLHRVLIPYRPDVTCTKRFHTILTGVRIQPKSEGFHTVLRVGHSGYLSHDTPFFLFFFICQNKQLHRHTHSFGFGHLSQRQIVRSPGELRQHENAVSGSRHRTNDDRLCTSWRLVSRC